MQEKAYKGRTKIVDELRSRILWASTNWVSALLIRQSGSGARVFVRVLAKTLNTNLVA